MAATESDLPDTIASHSREQVSYFGPDGLLWRHEYTVDVLGAAPGLNYALDYRDVDGIMMPVTRRIYAYDTNKQKILDPVLVAIDMRDIAFSADEDADDCTPRFQQTPKNRLALYT